MSMTSSEFQQQVTYQRALEGELASTIAAMEGVTNASVKLAIPQDTVFAEQADAPTASVFIETSAGASLGSGAVQAIVHLVSASIEGMDPANVAVIDANGVVLSTLGGDASTVMQAGQVATGAEASANAGIQAYTVNQALVLRKTPSPSAPQVRSFAPGDLVYPTGQKNGIWWEVDDENGNRGWVSSAFITPRG